MARSVLLVPHEQIIAYLLRKNFAQSMRRHLVPLCGFRYNAFVYENCILCSCAVRRDGAVRRCGVVRADGLRVIGVDNDLQICEHTVPTLTSVLPDHEKAGFFAAELLADRLAHPKAREALRPRQRDLRAHAERAWPFGHRPLTTRSTARSVLLVPHEQGL